MSPLWLGLTGIFCVGVLFGLLVYAVSSARKRPGLRRHKEDPDYKGPWRRESDCTEQFEDEMAENGVMIKKRNPK